MKHESVMLKSTVEMLNIRPEGIYVDGTLGRGGHSSEILRRLTTGHLYSFDIDQQALDESGALLKSIGNNYTLIKDNFADMEKVLDDLGVDRVDGILLDIGVSSPQFDDPARGFSYRYDSRLDMRMDTDQSLTAWQVVNEYPYSDLVRILYRYGEEKYARQIARNIEKARTEKPIETTFELVDIIKRSMPAKEVNKKGHPAKQSFQALRIEVNGELENLRKGIRAGLAKLNISGRMAVISFHSLEDEIVKEEFRNACEKQKIDKRIPLKESEMPQSEYQLVNRKPITADEEELEKNHRAHSAKLRVIERRNIL